MRIHLSIGVLLVATLVACENGPPPVLTVTSPTRSLVQSETGKLTVTGTAMPGVSGDTVTQVTVNHVPAKLTPDGAFTAVLDAPPGAMLLETVATSDSGGSVTDMRAVQTGQLRPVGAGIDRAITAALSADAFAKLSATAGPLIKGMNLPALLAPLQPMVSSGNSVANLKLAVTDLKLADIKIALAPVTGGLSFSAQISGLAVTANAIYAGALVPDGSTTVNVAADQVTIAGTLAVTPSGVAGFTSKLVNPAVNLVGLRLSATGLPGEILSLLNSVLGSSMQTVVAKVAELAIGPLVNQALGALAGPQQVDVLGKKLHFQVSPSAVAFSPAGAVVTLNLSALIEGSEASPGYIFTSNGAPVVDGGRGIQLGLADDLVNELLAEAHALHLLDLDLRYDVGVFDTAQLKLTMPPMINADTKNGAMRLVLGDMIGVFSKQGSPVVSAAVNAQIDLKIAPAGDGRMVALQLGAAAVQINLLDGTANPLGLTGDDLADATSQVIGFQTDSLSKLLITIPVPAVAGIQLTNLSLGADSGYVMVSGQIE